jgi:bifunctional non-homologous end joining protein LigD
MKSIQVGRYKISVTHSDRVLFPQSNVAKQDLLVYYNALAPFILPYLKNRPLTMVRYPEGIAQEGFFQKNIPEYFPEWIARKVVEKQDGQTTYALCNNRATLLYLANQSCITLHPWLSKVDLLEKPDMMIFDLDPSDNNFRRVCTLALELKDLLEQSQLYPFVKTTGSRGLHVVVPIRRTATFQEVKTVAQKFAQQLLQKNSLNATIELRKNKRAGKVFIDVLRNNFAQTAVVPYSVRAIEHAPVAMPIFWHELKDQHLTAQTYTIHNAREVLSERGDPWKDFFKCARSVLRLL